MAGGNPGPDFPSRSNDGPFNTPNGGHVCVYLMNSTGGTTSATTLPSANNRKASALANERAGVPVARGRMSRAGCQEANIRSGSTAVTPPTEMPNVSVNYRIEVTGSSVNIRLFPSTNAAIITSVRAGQQLDIEREQTGLDAQIGNPNAIWLRIRGGQWDGLWIIQRFTRKLETPPASTIPPAGTWSVQVMAARPSPESSARVDEIVGRLRGMGYPGAFRTENNGWYQIRVHAGTEAQARTLFPILRNQGFPDAFPVQN